MRPTRRQYLAAAAGTALAGCLGSGEDTTTPPGDGSATGSGDGTATAADVTRLESLSVGGSPGGTLPVRKPGTVSLVDFFATWCAPCRPQMDNLGAVRSSFGTDELYMTSITSESDEPAIREFWKEYDGEWPVLLDPKLVATQQYDVKGIPTLVLLDRSGETVWKHRGLAGKDTLKQKVREAVDG